MFLPIYTYGQPVLREVAQDITPDYPELPTLIENMFETMDKSDGVGLAAPQVGLDEGCLSLPGINEPVRRPKRVRVQWMDPDFTPHDEWIDGFLARVLQHEIDHLDGKVFTDKISPLRRQLIKKKLSNLLSGKFSCRYKVKTK